MNLLPVLSLLISSFIAVISFSVYSIIPIEADPLVNPTLHDTYPPVVDSSNREFLAIDRSALQAQPSDSATLVSSSTLGSNLASNATIARLIQQDTSSTTLTQPTVPPTPTSTTSSISSASTSGSFPRFLQVQNDVIQSQTTSAPSTSAPLQATNVTTIQKLPLLENVLQPQSSSPPPSSSPTPAPIQVTSIALASTSTFATTSAPVLASSSPLPPSTSVPASAPPASAPSSAITTLPSSNGTVQFLKPKSKFKCLQPTDCLNGGICVSGACFCSPGFTGESCAINIDECRQMVEPCLNNGVCVDEVNQFRCDCLPGFQGDRCQEHVDMCASLPCLNGAKCINHRINYTCECEPGWEGNQCEKNIDECLKNPCQNNGTCHDAINDYVCDCGSSGFEGKNCDIDFDDCKAKPCSSFGAKECVDLTNGFRCVCHDGFEGKTCDIDIDECQNNPCENNGTCIEIPHPHNSTTDNTLYHQEIRDRPENSSPMLTNLSHLSGYTCECKEEYYGARCEEKKKCYTKSVQELCNNQHAECVNVDSSYECLINASFDGSGNNYATYKVIGDFKLKEIFVKYRSITGGVIMSFTTATPETPIDLQLKKTGFYLSGTPIKPYEDTKVEDLLDGIERDVRLPLALPIEIKGITLTRQNIINEDLPPFKGCLMQVRLNNQLLPLLDYGEHLNHTFQMYDSHLEVGQCHTCFEKDCQNRGYCQYQDGFDHCSCPETFTGTYCEIDVNECETQSKNFPLCLNGSTCENFHGGHRCNCKEGYRGEKCQEIFDYCKAKQPCATGTCKNVNPAQGIFQCECPSSHIGKRCEQKRHCLNECSINQHAQCVNNVTCACLPGKREERNMCEYVSSCEQVEGELCLNGGVCKNIETGGYHCECPEPFSGPVCQLIERSRFDALVSIVITGAILLVIVMGIVAFVFFRSVRKARATRGTYSPSTQEKYGNSASDLLKPPQPERLI